MSQDESTDLQSLSDTWTKKRSLLPYRTRMAAGTIKGVIYVVGGLAIDWVANETHGLGRVDAYYIASNTWSQMAPMPASRESPNGASAIDDKLYVTGGKARDGRIAKTLFVYNPMTNTWTRKADMPTPGGLGRQKVGQGSGPWQHWWQY